MSEAAEQSRTRPPLTEHRAHLLIVVLACLGQFMVVLDVSIVNVALPSISQDLGFTQATLQWVVSAYALTFAGLLLLGGRIADLYGHKRIFIAGVVLFTGASLLGGLASTPGLLIAARAVQGVGAAVLAPATLTILTTTFTEGPRRAKAIASWSAVGAVGGAVGGLLGGLLTEQLSWRWILLINVPVGIALVAAAAAFLTESARSHGRRGAGLDVAGTLLVTGGISTLAYGTVQSPGHGWDSPQALIPIALGVVALAAFVLVEARVSRAPLVPLRLFRSRAVSGGNLVMALMGAASIAMWYFLSLHMQENLGYSPVQTGLAFIPHTLTLIVGARLCTRLIPLVGERRLIGIGSLVAAAGFVWQGRMDPGYVPGVLLPGLLMCLGMALNFTPVALLTTSGARDGEAGLLSGLLNTARQVGGSLGLAALATVAAAGATTSDGYGMAFTASAGLMVVAFAAVFLLPRRPRLSTAA
ncbi:MFS transporter [Microtetraspora sp. NBRC 13810]|uniref:MFS transporter n=1 Tax=Microtetraspora sp. NBRC 13810 TaxID=3030990 RepID=UPI0025550F5F|nr:MFS transporter [Microtetraspora sp. NBRC 13810]GLW09043.1 MFS transporter [Microtetraspora sp. NBRC 13810]